VSCCAARLMARKRFAFPRQLYGTRVSSRPAIHPNAPTIARLRRAHWPLSDGSPLLDVGLSNRAAGLVPACRPAEASAWVIPRISGRGYSQLMTISRQSIALMATALGHKLRVRPTRRAFVAECSCGYLSASRYSTKLAVEAAAVHQVNVIRAHQASGRPWPRLESDTPGSGDTFERRARGVA